MPTKSLIKTSVERRMLILIVFASILAGIFTTSITLFSSFNYQKQDLRESIAKIINSNSPAMAQALWNFDVLQGSTIAKGLLEAEGVSYVKVKVDGQDTPFVSLDNGKNSEGHISIPLTYHSPLSEKNEVIGNLEIGFNENSIRAKTVELLLTSLISEFLKVIFLSATILYFTKSFFTRYLKEISLFLSKISSSHKVETLKLDRTSTLLEGEDEFFEVTTNINNMISNIENFRDYREKLNKELGEANLQQRLLEVSNGLVHNLGNLLTIQGGLQQRLFKHLKAEQIESNDITKAQTLQLISKLESNMNVCIDSIKSQQFAAKSRGREEAISLLSLSDDLDLLLEKELINKSIIFEKHIEDLHVLFRKSQLMLVVINLIKNSIEALVTNKTENPKIVLISIKKDDKVHVIVRDNGPGISNEILDRLFEFGVTNKESGHGFGLSSSRQLMQSSGGNLIYDQSYKEGASFEIILPLINVISKVA